jgi:NAD(P)-dependent dehydrogenase (short-subunit alcohol dehydrogenase family)
VRLEGRAAIVTGGGHGIGRAIALRFAAEGCAVTIAGTNRERLEATSRELHQLGARVLISVTDVTDEDAVGRMANRTLHEFRRIDILVNNAGITGPTIETINLEREEWDRTLAVNLTGAFICVQNTLPHMMTQQSGRIINITSVAGFIGYPLRAAYAVSKWGMIGLTRTLALEAGPHGITVNAIAPGSTRGERMSRVIQARAQALGKSEADIEREYLDPTALKRMVSEEDVAATALFLASDEAASITGETIAVSGGFRI